MWQIWLRYCPPKTFSSLKCSTVFCMLHLQHHASMYCSTCSNVCVLLQKARPLLLPTQQHSIAPSGGLARPTKSLMMHQVHMHTCKPCFTTCKLSVTWQVCPCVTHTCSSAVLLVPRALWLRLCGGLTVQDLLLVCMWAAINLSWFTAAFAYYQRKATLKAAANGLAGATGQQVLKAAARSFGATLAPNLVLLFYPVSRGSVVLQMTGLSYPAGIR